MTKLTRELDHDEAPRLVDAGNHLPAWCHTWSNVGSSAMPNTTPWQAVASPAALLMM